LKSHAHARSGARAGSFASVGRVWLRSFITNSPRRSKAGAIVHGRPAAHHSR
jgi:hypothetical protein